MNDQEIKLIARELSHKYLASHPSLVNERNEKIIEELMKMCNISREKAERCFLDNNES